MAIVLSGSVTQPALTYSKLHIDNFSLIQKRETNPKRVITALGTPYAINAASEKVFSPDVKQAQSNDFDAVVILDHLANNAGSTVTDAIAAQTYARTAAAAEFAAGTLTNAKLMAYFEVAIGRIFQLSGAANFQTIE